MKTIKHLLAILLCLALSAPLTQARPVWSSQQETQTTKANAQDVLIIIQQEQVRFTSQKPVAEMQLQIFDQAGQTVYDSGPVTEPELTWVLRQPNGEAVKSGLYAYTLSVREAGAETARVRRGHFIVDRAKERDGQTDRLWITSQNDSGVGTELTVARNEGSTIAGTNMPGERGQTEGGAARDGAGESKSDSNAAITALVSGTAGRIAKFTSATDLGNSIITEQNGKIGIGAPNPLATLHIVSSDHVPPRVQSIGDVNFAAGWDFYHGTTGKGYVGVPGTGVGLAPGEMLVYGATGTPTSIWAGGVRGLTVGINGNVGIGTTIANAKLSVVNNDVGIVSRTTGGFAAIFGDTSYANGYGGLFSNTGGGIALGVIGVTRTGTLQITGGADFAENFEVSSAQMDGEESTTQIEAGMVVAIDPTSPGKLQLSTQAYDRRVAGVISGAGGVKPGMVMGQEGTLADGKHPVALSGRVYVWVDAAQGAIEPGDLLTTSSTPGHAMKATDAVKAQGAIIGKAMTGLKEGKGLVLVLVTLQ